LISDFFFFQLHFFKGRKHFPSGTRFGANIFQRLQTFLIRRKGLARTFSKGHKHFSSGAKVWREHFSKAANIPHQTRRFGANIFKVRLFFHSKANNFKKRLRFHLFQA
jgi:hypothetical protein